MVKKEQQNTVNEVCRISAATTFANGVLHSLADVRIDGKFEGDIVVSGKLVLGEQAVVKGNIYCNSADISGNVSGDIYVREILTFKSTAKFSGNLKVSKISIEAGAIFKGTCDIIDDKEYDSLYKGRSAASKV